MKLGFSRQIFERRSNIKFHQNRCSGSRVVLCGQTDRTKPIVAFRNFANAPKNWRRDLNPYKTHRTVYIDLKCKRVKVKFVKLKKTCVGKTRRTKPWHCGGPVIKLRRGWFWKSQKYNRKGPISKTRSKAYLWRHCAHASVVAQVWTACSRHRPRKCNKWDRSCVTYSVMTVLFRVCYVSHSHEVQRKQPNF